MAEHYRVRFTDGSIHGVVKASKRHLCDGHLNHEKHWIEPGERYVANALPPHNSEIGNATWWHLRVCMDCAPVEYAEAQQ